MSFPLPGLRQRGAVLITGTVLILMAAMTASVSMRASTYSMAMAASQISQEHAHRVAQETLRQHVLNETLIVSPTLTNLRRSADAQTQVIVQVKTLGSTPSVPLPGYDKERDRDLQAFYFDIVVIAQHRSGASASVGASVMHIAPSTQRTGRLDPALGIARQRYGKTRHTLAWRLLP